MAISSGRCRMPSMEHSREFFCVNKPFWYSPLSDKNVHILIEAIPCTNATDNGVFGKMECEKYCALSKWCGERGNFDTNGENHIPCCSDYDREDKTNVFFKEIG